MGALLDNLEVLNRTEGGDSWGRAATNDLLRNRIKIRSLNFMRGRTFLNRYVILDEAQNLTSKQMKALITRAGPARSSSASATSSRSTRRISRRRRRASPTSSTASAAGRTPVTSRSCAASARASRTTLGHSLKGYHGTGTDRHVGGLTGSRPHVQFPTGF
jgi:hypothetical protein